MKKLNVIQMVEKMQSDGCPLGQSFTQNQSFIIDMESTPARQKRSAKLQLDSAITTYIDVYYNYEEMALDIEELEEQLGFKQLTSFERRRKEIKIEKLKLQKFTESDKLRELEMNIKHMYSVFNSYKAYTREEFEDEEVEYYVNKIGENLLGLNSGGKRALANLGITEEVAMKTARITTENARLRTESLLEDNKKHFPLLGGDVDGSNMGD